MEVRSVHEVLQLGQIHKLLCALRLVIHNDVCTHTVCLDTAPVSDNQGLTLAAEIEKFSD